MFKKLKDKLAEEVKSSPQRIQQFAQAAQAAVTSASSSITDITNNDLFSIGDGDSQTAPRVRPQTRLGSLEPSSFEQLSYNNTPTNESGNDEFLSLSESTPRQRRLSNSSMASDVSFKFPTYETPSMYHLQSDLEISASEAEERTLSSPAGMSLERVTKEQLYSAYRRTQERYAKYRTQYADLARHYKLLERENSKARSVLVETQDKALRRISELREQCSLEQSAKAHLEQALRVEIDEKNDQISALTTKLKLLQTDNLSTSTEASNISDVNINENKTQLIDLSFDDTQPAASPSPKSGEIEVFTKKIEMLEQLSNKYKESMKVQKEKNAQLNTEILVLRSQIDKHVKKIEELQKSETAIQDCNNEIKKLKEENEELQNKVNTFEFKDGKKKSELEIDFERAKEKILSLQHKIDIFTKKEEEYAISLAENKLSIHKELESKETEIKNLKDSLESSEKEMDSLKIILDTYKQKVATYQDENAKLVNEIKDLQLNKRKASESETENIEYMNKFRTLEQTYSQLEESYKCLLLQIKQETAEKLALKDRNTYLEERIKQLTDDIIRKNEHITSVQNELNQIKVDSETLENTRKLNLDLHLEIKTWKEKYQALESEIQDEREELVKLQTEIEKMITNYNKLEAENVQLSSLRQNLKQIQIKIQDIKTLYLNITCSIHSLINLNGKLTSDFQEKIIIVLKQLKHESEFEDLQTQFDFLNEKYINVSENLTKYKIDLDKAGADIGKMKEELHYSNQTSDQVNSQQNKIRECEIENERLQSTVDKLTADLKDSNHRIDHLSKELNEKENILKNNKEEFRNKLQEKALIESQVTNQYEEMQNILDEKILLEKANEESVLNIRKFETTLTNMKEENENLQNKLKESATLDSQMKDQHLEMQRLLNEKVSLEKVNEQQVIKVCELENKILELRQQCKQAEEKISLVNKECKESKDQITKLHSTVKQANGQTESYTNEITDLKNVNERLKEEIETLKQYNEVLTKKVSESKGKIDKNYNEIKEKAVQYEQKIQTLISEADLARTENEKLTIKIKDLENKQIDSLHLNEERKLCQIELDKYKTLHERLETENKDLNLKVANLQELCNVVGQDTETLRLKCEQMKQEKEEIYEKVLNLEQKINDIQQSKDSELQTIKETNNAKMHELKTKYNNFESELENQNIENRRLLSEIEGLQTYLKNISNENNQLNDKIRSMMSSDEYPYNNTLQSEINEARSIIQNLTIENSELKEENTRMKEDVTSKKAETPHSHAHASYEAEENKEQINQILAIKDELENKIADLETLNHNANRNLTCIQDKNQKLSVNNQKLERRLDEALVSLRHLHSLQENTELEYLRNVLYEYLTGPGTHSITLAKVLAAVVKFDDQQTHNVLQKEKERQGLLRQLGLS